MIHKQIGPVEFWGVKTRLKLCPYLAVNRYGFQYLGPVFGFGITNVKFWGAVND